MRELHRVGFSAANRGFGHARGPRYLRVLPLHKVLQAVLIVALLAVAAAAVDLMTVPYQGYNNDQCTNHDDVLADINNIIPTPGSGTSTSLGV